MIWNLSRAGCEIAPRFCGGAFLLWVIAIEASLPLFSDDLITEIDERPVASRDFSAIELTCSAGEAVDVIWGTHGWAWCRKCDGSEGWLPIGNLSER